MSSSTNNQANESQPTVPELKGIEKLSAKQVEMLRNLLQYSPESCGLLQAIVDRLPAYTPPPPRLRLRAFSREPAGFKNILRDLSALAPEGHGIFDELEGLSEAEREQWMADRLRFSEWVDY